jgi:hypothetical protein
MAKGNPSGTIKYAEVQVGESRIMMGEHQEVAAVGPGIPPTSIYLRVPDVDAVFDRAAAGGKRDLPAARPAPGTREGRPHDRLYRTPGRAARSGTALRRPLPFASTAHGASCDRALSAAAPS